MIRSVEDPDRFVLYEWYVDEAAAKAHKTTPHYDAWREAIADWLVEPRYGVRYDGLFPETAAGSTAVARVDVHARPGAADHVRGGGFARVPEVVASQGGASCW